MQVTKAKLTFLFHFTTTILTNSSNSSFVTLSWCSSGHNHCVFSLGPMCFTITSLVEQNCKGAVKLWGCGEIYWTGRGPEHNDFSSVAVWISLKTGVKKLLAGGGT